MAVTAKIDLQLQGWDTFGELLKGPEFKRILRMKTKDANKRLAVLGVARLSQEIRGGKFEQNSPFTVFLKKSSKPLVDHGDLVGSVSFTHKNRTTFDVGVLRRTASGRNLAHMLETGWTQKVTPAMRRWFFAMAKESGGRIKGLKKSTTHIRVKPRPYMKQAFFDDKDFQLVIQRGWQEALDQAYTHFAEKQKREPWK